MHDTDPSCLLNCRDRFFHYALGLGGRDRITEFAIPKQGISALAMDMEMNDTNRQFKKELVRVQILRLKSIMQMLNHATSPDLLKVCLYLVGPMFVCDSYFLPFCFGTDRYRRC